MGIWGPHAATCTCKTCLTDRIAELKGVLQKLLDPKQHQHMSSCYVDLGPSEITLDTVVPLTRVQYALLLDLVPESV